MLIMWIIIEDVDYGNAESAASWRHREKGMPGSAGRMHCCGSVLAGASRTERGDPGNRVPYHSTRFFLNMWFR